MKKMIVGGTVLVLAYVVLRRFGPTVGKRAMAKCQEMMASRGDTTVQPPIPVSP